ARTLVAVGTVSDCCMFLTIAAAAPRIGLTCSPSAGFTGAALAAATGDGLPVLGRPGVGDGVGVGGGAWVRAAGWAGAGCVLAGACGALGAWPLVAGGALGGLSRGGAVLVEVPAARTTLAASVAALPVGCATLSPTPAARWVGL